MFFPACRNIAEQGSRRYIHRMNALKMVSEMSDSDYLSVVAVCAFSVTILPLLVYRMYTVNWIRWPFFWQMVTGLGGLALVAWFIWEAGSLHPRNSPGQQYLTELTVARMAFITVLAILGGVLLPLSFIYLSRDFRREGRRKAVIVIKIMAFAFAALVLFLAFDATIRI